jgi:hypothetical protein
MQHSGRLTILSMLALAAAMAGGAWWRRYQATNEAVRFWGAEGASLLAAAPVVEFLELTDQEPTASPLAAEQLAGRQVRRRHDLSHKPGLVHLRHVFTLDDNFRWQVKRELASRSEWRYALRFLRGREQLIILFNPTLQLLGKLEPGGRYVSTLDAHRPAAPIARYLTDIGVLDAAAAERGAEGRPR